TTPMDEWTDLDQAYYDVFGEHPATKVAEELRARTDGFRTESHPDRDHRDQQHHLTDPGDHEPDGGRGAAARFLGATEGDLGSWPGRASHNSPEDHQPHTYPEALVDGGASMFIASEPRHRHGPEALMMSEV
ncbi:hypothetical protein, partial [Nocardioides sp.]|uniref:hypothetical protein n=1 Tax=Nocardioides sp. TaxID=35761 RepID=UPI003569493F